MGIPDHLTCLLRNLYAGQEATVGIEHRTMPWFKIRKGVWQGCILSPYFLNLYAEYIMQNAGLDEAEAGIKDCQEKYQQPHICRWHHRYGRKRRTKEPLDEVKEESEKAGLKLNIQKTKIMASSPITSWQIDWKTMETVAGFIFLASKITVDGNCSYEIKRRLLLGRKAMSNLDGILKSRDITLPTMVCLV